jgi:ATP-dependent DNA helicase RecG
VKQLELPFNGPILALLTPDEIFANAAQSLLQQLHEDRRIEYKSSRVDRRDLGEYFSMWANTRPAGGLLAVGIEKDGTVSGCIGLSTQGLNSLEKAGREMCPDCREEIKRLPVVNANGQDDFVLLIRVPYREDKVVRATSGKAFIRRGDEKHELTDDEIRELQIDKRELDFEREPAYDAQWPSDFDSELVELFCESVRSKWSLKGEQTNEQILHHRRLAVRGKTPPNSMTPVSIR